MNGIPPSSKILVHFREQLQLKLAHGHGKGIRYVGEYVRRKEGKTGK